MIRAFIAAEIDLPNKKKISELIGELKKSKADVKWITENQIHITLKFLGNIEKEQVQKMSGALGGISRNFSAFDIQFSKLGAFPNMKRPRVIWIGVEKGGDLLSSLNEKIETALEKIGFTKEKREYRVHLTLGRVKSLKNITSLAELIDKIDFQSTGEIKIDRLTLFQSTLTPKGAIYTPLLTSQLKQGSLKAPLLNYTL